ncbi:MAG: sensor histidine kinase, partial [Candidatus Dojkabacteria bacterium]
ILFYFFSLVFIRVYFLKRNYKLSLVYLSIWIISFSLINSYIGTTTIAVGFALVTIVILSISIVIGLRATVIAIILFSIPYLAIALYHGDLEKEYIARSDPQSTIMLIILIAVIVQITRLGFSEIQYSYNQALKYSQKLELLNKELDKKVKQRTKRLKQNFDEQIEASYKLALIGEIAQPTLHDLATPISALEGTIDILKRTNDPVEEAEMLAIAEETLKEMNDIIVCSKETMRGNETQQVFMLKESLTRIAKIFKSQFMRYGIEFETEFETDLELNGNRSKFERAVLNLINNAFDELKKEKNEGEENPKISLHCYKDEDGLYLLEVKDNGEGIRPEEIDNIFTEGYSKKTKSGNLGLGLTFVKDVIEDEFGGSITVESLLGKGTKFIIALDEKS